MKVKDFTILELFVSFKRIKNIFGKITGFANRKPQIDDTCEKISAVFADEYALKSHPALKTSYSTVDDSYGGSQEWFTGNMKNVGCGIVAAFDIILYESEKVSMANGNPKDTLTQYQYRMMLNHMKRRWFPLLPGLGLTGSMLSFLINRYLRVSGIPLRAKYGCFSWKINERIRSSLSKDHPVILAIGQNFPFFWKKERLAFYADPACTRQTASAKAHFVTITGATDDAYRISSWGREYYINIDELKSYVRNHSSWLISNIIVFHEK